MLRTDRFSPHSRRGAAAKASAGLGWLFGGLLLCAACVLHTTGAHAQPTAGKQPPAPAASGTTPATPKAPASTRPLWNELTPTQQKSLAPLEAHWNGLHPAQKRKWIALSGNFDSMSPSEQEVLHSRMTEWAALSAQDRTRARLNFAEVKRLAPEEERKAKWEAYQALSDEEKRKLAERAGTRPPSAAAPVRPVPAQKLAPVPSVTAGSPYPTRIQLAPPASAPAATPVSVPVAPAAPAAATAAAAAPATPSSAASPATPVNGPASPAPAAAVPATPKLQEAP